MLQILLIILPLFLIIFLGAILRRFELAGVGWSDTLNKFALHIGLPALIFSALSSTQIDLKAEVGLIVINSLFIISSFIIAFLAGKLFKLNKQTFKTLFICLGFGNTAYLGIPVLTQLEGESVLPQVSLIVTIYLIWLFTIGIGYLEYSKKKKARDSLKIVVVDLIKNPLLIAVFLGLIFSIFRIQVPEIFSKTISMLAASVTPLVLFVIGIFIGKAKWGKLREWWGVISYSSIRLLLLPGLLFLTLLLLNIEPANYSSTIIEAAMPLAITPFALAKQYKLDEIFIARSIVLTTILSIITIPFWTSII